MRFYGFLFMIFFFAGNCSINKEHSDLKGPYLGQDPPGMTPVLFAPGIVSGGNIDWTTTFTPDGLELYYTIAPLDNMVLVCMKSENGVWQKPHIPAFAESFNNYADPYVAPDGKRLYFWSNRPVEPSAQPENNADLWYVDLLNDGTYSDPVRISGIVNTSDWQVFPTVSSSGDLYFSGYYADDNYGRFDIYMSKLVDGEYTKPVNLGESINTEHIEHEPFIAPDGSYIIFCSDRHDPGTNKWDLYISFRKPKGNWTEAVNMGDKINSPEMDQAALVTSDGKYMFFSSSRLDQALSNMENPTYSKIIDSLNKPGNGNSDVYWVDSKIIEELREQILK